MSALSPCQLGSLTGLLLVAGKESCHEFVFPVFVLFTYICIWTSLNFALQIILKKLTFACLSSILRETAFRGVPLEIRPRGSDFPLATWGQNVRKLKVTSGFWPEKSTELHLLSLAQSSLKEVKFQEVEG